MTIDRDNLLNSILESIDRIHNVESSEIPGIDLYVDQVTTIMGKMLRQSTRNPEEDKIMTKTMINNYAKNNLIPSPENKKYTREHMVLLIFIYYSKGLLSITDIQTLLNPLTERYFNSEGDINLCSIYDEVFSMEKERTQEIKEDISQKFKRAGETFKECEGDYDRQMLQLFAFIYMLGYDVYTKKLLIEKLLDEFAQVTGQDGGRTQKGSTSKDKELKAKNSKQPGKGRPQPGKGN